MCGRFSLIVKHVNLIADRFKAEVHEFDWSPRFNVAPAQYMPVIVANKNIKSIKKMKWGLVPSWSKDGKMHYAMINARAETLWEKPSFKNIIKSRRCIIPADGFYEWKKEAGQKNPYRITRRDEKIFGFAGIWDEWQQENSAPLQTFTIITTKANDLLKTIHDRMPVIIHPDDEENWLNHELTSKNEIEPLLTSYPSSLMKKNRVSSIVNSWKNDSEECLKTYNED